MTAPKYTKADMDAVADNPELTAEDIAQAKPFAEVFPELAKTIRPRGPQKAPKKIATYIRLSPSVIEHYRAGGKGWQSRIDEDLRKLIGSDSR